MFRFALDYGGLARTNLLFLLGGIVLPIEMLEFSQCQK